MAFHLGYDSVCKRLQDHDFETAASINLSSGFWWLRHRHRHRHRPLHQLAIWILVDSLSDATTLQLHDVIKQWLVCNCNPSTEEAGTAKYSFFCLYHPPSCRYNWSLPYSSLQTSPNKRVPHFKEKLLLWKFSVFIYWFSNFTNASGLATAGIWSCLQGFWKAAWLFGKRRGGGGGGGGCELKEREGGKTKEAPSNKAQRMSLLDSLSRSPAAMASTLAT